MNVPAGKRTKKKKTVLTRCGTRTEGTYTRTRTHMRAYTTHTHMGGNTNAQTRRPFPRREHTPCTQGIPAQATHMRIPTGHMHLEGYTRACIHIIKCNGQPLYPQSLCSEAPCIIYLTPGASAKGVPTNNLNKKVVERVVVQSGGHPGA